MRRSALLAVLFATAAWAEQPTAIFCPLEVEPNPRLTPILDALRKRFFSAARDSAGMNILARLEAESIVAASGLQDFERSDASLVRVAELAKVQYAGYARLSLTPADQLVLTGRVVRNDGKVVALGQAELPRGKKPLPDVVGELTERLFLQLQTRNLPARDAVVTAPPPPPPPMLTADAPRAEPAPPAPVTSVAPITEVSVSPAHPLRTAGFVVAGVGAAAAIGGVLLFATAGTLDIRNTPQGDIISATDVGRVDEVRTKQGLGLGLVIGGATIAAAGVITALVLGSQQQPVTAGFAPLDGGALVALGGVL